MSLSLEAKSIDISFKHISLNEKVNIEVSNNTDENIELVVIDPDGRIKSLHVITAKNADVINYAPEQIGEYTFKFGDDSRNVWVHRKPTTTIIMSKVFVTNLPISFMIPKQFRNEHYIYNWKLFMGGTELMSNTSENFSFIPEVKGSYSLKLKVSDKRVPQNNLSTTIIYRTFEVKDRIDSFKMNLPTVVYKDQLPFEAHVFKPFNNKFQVKWFIGEDPKPLDRLILTEDMFINSSLNISARVYKGDVVVGQKTSRVNFEGKRLNTGYISVVNLPSGNIEIRSDGDGILQITDPKILSNSLIITDNYIVIKPLVNHAFDITLRHNDDVLDSFRFSNIIDFYSFDFEVDLLTDENVMPSFYNFSISKINIPTEKIKNITFYINEKKIKTKNKKSLLASAYSDLLGINTARIEIMLQTNEIIIQAKKFTVSSSTSPVCSIEYEHSLREIWARCTDTDSYVKEYAFSIADKFISSRNSFILPETYKGEFITLAATDALGNRGVWEFIINDDEVTYEK